MALLKNVREYTKNLGKSLAYAAIDDITQNKMPIFKETIEQNEEFIAKTTNFVKNFKSESKKIEKEIKQSEHYSVMGKIVQNSKKELKSGNIFKNMDDMSDDVLESMAKDMGIDIDFDDGDDFKEDWDSEDESVDDLEKSGKSDTLKGASLTAKASIQGAAVVSNSVLAGSEYVGGTIKQAASMQYAQSMRHYSMVSAGFDSLSTGISNISAVITGPLKTHIENANKFFTSTTDLLTKQNAMINEILEMKRNQYQKAQVDERKKKKGGLADVVDLDSGAINLEGLMGTVKKNLGDSPMGTLMEYFSDPQMLKMIASNPMSILATFLVPTLMGPNLNKALSDLGKTLSGVFPTLLAKINNNKGKNAWGAFSSLVDLFAVGNNKQQFKYKAQAATRDPVPFNGLTQKAITEVIPMYLARIEAALTGRTERVYEYETGKWTTFAEADKKYNKMVREAGRSALNNDDFIAHVNWQLRTQKATDDQVKALEKITSELIDTYGGEMSNDHFLLKDNNITKRQKDYWKTKNISEKDVEFALKILNNVKNQSKTRMAANVADAANKSNDTLNEIQDYSIYSLIASGAWNGSKDGKLVPTNGDDIYKAIKSGRNLPMVDIGNRTNEILIDIKHILSLQAQISAATSTTLTSAQVKSINRHFGKVGNIKGKFAELNTFAEKLHNTQAKNPTTKEAIRQTNDQLTENRYEYGSGNGLFDATGNSAAVIRMQGIQDYLNGRLPSIEFRKLLKKEPGLKRTFDGLRKDKRRFKNLYKKYSSNQKLTDDEKKEYNRLNAKFQGVEKDIASYGYESADDDFQGFGTNEDAEEYLRLEGNNLGEKLRNADGVFEKLGVLGKYFAHIRNKPTQFIADIVGKVDDTIYNFFYNQADATRTDKNGKPITGFFNNLMYDMEDLFNKMHDSFQENVCEPIKNFFNDNVKNTSGYQAAKKTLVNAGKGAAMSVKDAIGAVFRGSRAKGGYVPETGLYALSKGEAVIPSDMNPYNPNRATADRRMDAIREQALLSNLSKRGLINVKGNYSDGTPLSVTAMGKYATEPSGGVVSMGSEYSKGLLDIIKNGNYTVKIDDSGTITIYGKDNDLKTIADGKTSLTAKEASQLDYGVLDKLIKQSSNSKEDKQSIQYLSNKAIKEATDSLSEKLGRGASKAAIGSIAGLMTLGPVGFFAGALLGGALEFTNLQEEATNFLFGDVDEKTGKRDYTTGLLPADVSEALPDMKNFGLLGGIAGGLTMGPLGLIGGMLAGSAGAYVVRTKKMGDVLEGELGEKTGLKKVSSFLRNHWKRTGLLSGAGGMVAKLALGTSPWGILGGMAIGAGMSYLSTSEEFKNAMLGNIGEDGKRHGGVKGTIMEEIVDPLKEHLKRNTDSFNKYMKKEVFEPAREALTGVAKSMNYMGSSLIKKLGKVITGNINYNNLPKIVKLLARDTKTRAMASGAVAGMLGFQMFGPAGALLGGLLGYGTSKSSWIRKMENKIAKKFVSIPMAPIKWIGKKANRWNINSGYSNNWTAQERLDYMAKTGKADYKYKQLDESLVNTSTGELKATQQDIQQIMALQSSSSRSALKENLKIKLNGVLARAQDFGLSDDVAKQIRTIVSKSNPTEDEKTKLYNIIQEARMDPEAKKRLINDIYGSEEGNIGLMRLGVYRRYAENNDSAKAALAGLKEKLANQLGLKSNDIDWTQLSEKINSELSTRNGLEDIASKSLDTQKESLGNLKDIVTVLQAQYEFITTGKISTETQTALDHTNQNIKNYNNELAIKAAKQEQRVKGGNIGLLPTISNYEQKGIAAGVNESNKNFDNLQKELDEKVDKNSDEFKEKIGKIVGGKSQKNIESNTNWIQYILYLAKDTNNSENTAMQYARMLYIAYTTNSKNYGITCDAVIRIIKNLSASEKDKYEHFIRFAELSYYGVDCTYDNLIKIINISDKDYEKLKKIILDVQLECDKDIVARLFGTKSLSSLDKITSARIMVTVMDIDTILNLSDQECEELYSNIKIRISLYANSNNIKIAVETLIEEIKKEDKELDTLTSLVREHRNYAKLGQGATHTYKSIANERLTNNTNLSDEERKIYEQIVGINSNANIESKNTENTNEVEPNTNEAESSINENDVSIDELNKPKKAKKRSKQKQQSRKQSSGGKRRRNLKKAQKFGVQGNKAEGGIINTPGVYALSQGEYVTNANAYNTMMGNNYPGLGSSKTLTTWQDGKLLTYKISTDGSTIPGNKDTKEFMIEKEEEKETQKGILDTLKGILEAVKGKASDIKDKLSDSDELKDAAKELFNNPILQAILGPFAGLLMWLNKGLTALVGIPVALGKMIKWAGAQFGLWDRLGKVGVIDKTLKSTASLRKGISMGWKKHGALGALAGGALGGAANLWNMTGSKVGTMLGKDWHINKFEQLDRSVDAIENIKDTTTPATGKHMMGRVGTPIPANGKPGKMKRMKGKLGVKGKLIAAALGVGGTLGISAMTRDDLAGADAGEMAENATAAVDVAGKPNTAAGTNKATPKETGLVKTVLKKIKSGLTEIARCAAKFVSKSWQTKIVDFCNAIMKRLSGMGVKKLATTITKKSMIGSLKTAALALGPLGLAINVGFAAYQFYDGWTSAGDWFEVKEGEEPSTAQKLVAGISSAALSFIPIIGWFLDGGDFIAIAKTLFPGMMPSANAKSIDAEHPNGTPEKQGENASKPTGKQNKKLGVLERTELALTNFGKGIKDSVVNIGTIFTDAIPNAFASAWEAIKGAIKNMGFDIDGFKQKIQDTINKFIENISNINLGNIISTAWTAVENNVAVHMGLKTKEEADRDMAIASFKRENNGKEPTESELSNYIGNKQTSASTKESMMADLEKDLAELKAQGKSDDYIAKVKQSRLAIINAKFDSKVTQQSASSNTTTNGDTKPTFWGNVKNILFGKKKATTGQGKYGRGMAGQFNSQLDPLNAMQFNTDGDTSYQNMYDSGCGPVSAVNALSSLGIDADPKAAASYALSNGYKEKNGGTKPGFFNSMLGKFGVGTSNISGNDMAIRQNLAAGNPVILMGKDNRGVSTRNPYGTGPHYVTATGLDSNGNIIIQDPQSNTPNSIYRSSDVLNKSSIAIAAHGRGFGYKYGRGGKFGKAKGNSMGEQIFDYLSSKYKLSDKVIAGIMGNMYQESKFDVNAVGDNGSSFGLCQWHFERKDALAAYAQNNGMSPSDYRAQCDYLMYELRNGYGDLLNRMDKASNEAEAAVLFCDEFERPEKGTEGARAEYARQIMKNKGAGMKEVASNYNGIGISGLSSSTSGGLFGMLDAIIKATSLSNFGLGKYGRGDEAPAETAIDPNNMAGRLRMQRIKQAEANRKDNKDTLDKAFSKTTSKLTSSIGAIGTAFSSAMTNFKPLFDKLGINPLNGLFGTTSSSNNNSTDKDSTVSGNVPMASAPSSGSVGDKLYQMLKGSAPDMEITSNYGTYRTIDGQENHHEGMDFAASEAGGENIYTPISGKIIGLNKTNIEGGGYGYYAQIQDSRGNYHMFAHMGAVSDQLELGQTVKAGTFLGTIGTTGHSTGPHLHYGITRDEGAVKGTGNSIDPGNYYGSGKFGRGAAISLTPSKKVMSKVQQFNYNRKLSKKVAVPMDGGNKYGRAVISEYQAPVSTTSREQVPNIDYNKKLDTLIEINKSIANFLSIIATAVTSGANVAAAPANRDIAVVPAAGSGNMGINTQAITNIWEAMKDISRK